MILLGNSHEHTPVHLDLRMANRHGIVAGATGTGKCHGRGTLVLMYDGTLRAIEDVRVGDQLMGPDSTPRNVIATGSGFGPMYTIQPVKGEPWTCNDAHILSLVRTNKDNIVDVELRDYLHWSKTQKRIHKLYRTGVTFAPCKPSAFDPYLVGLYLGSGDHSNPMFHFGENEHILHQYVRRSLSITRESAERGCLSTYFSRNDPFWEYIRQYINTTNDRRIPIEMKTGSPYTRRLVLAGLVDSDARINKNGVMEYVTKYPSLADDVCFVARSIGLAAYKKKCTKGIISTGFSATYYRVRISGYLTAIPALLNRAPLHLRGRRQNEAVLRTGFKVHPIGIGEYFGVVIDGDHRYLLGDFTVTHNTVTLQALAESFAYNGVPVFASDAKGDLSGIAKVGTAKSFIVERCKLLGIEPQFDSPPVKFWDLQAEQGHPVRTTVYSLGPLILSRMLSLNDTQEGVVNIMWQFCDDFKIPLRTFADLKAVLLYMGENAKALGSKYGGVSATSLATIQRRLLVLQRQGAEQFFGIEAFDIRDFIQTDERGYGQVNLLAADKLMEAPKLYSSFLLWLMTELFAKLPEIGNPQKPVMVFFFDEAHLLFKDAPKSLLEQIERVVRLIRSKGVGIYFVTQSPADIPPSVAAQLGNRVQHALRGFTGQDWRTIRTTAQTMRPNPKLTGMETHIQELRVGEALVSVLDNKGVPGVTQRVMLAPPRSQVGPLTADERLAFLPTQEPLQPTVEPSEAPARPEPEQSAVAPLMRFLARMLK